MASALLNIAALAARTGVPADTLRKWEERYGVLRPARTAGGQRRYSDVDVQRVEWLKARLAEGYRIGEAAAMLTPGSPPAASARELRRALYAAAKRSESPAIAQLLDQTLSLHPLRTSLRSVFVPLLRDIGEGWERGELSVAQEHLVSSAIRARLDVLMADVRGNVRGVAVLACAPGERHELGLLMLGTLLRADGWQVAYLGADTPFADALELARKLGGRALAVSVAMDQRVPRLRTMLRARRNGVQIVLGGAAATSSLARELGAVYGGADLDRAAATLRRLPA